MGRISMHTPRGVTLIMVAAVMAILAALATGFYTMTLSQSNAAIRYSDSVRAEMLARGGIQDGIARLRQGAFEKTEDPTDPWYTIDWLDGGKKRISFATPDGAPPAAKLSYTRAVSSTAGVNSDRYTLEIADAASKININAGDNLAVILDNLCRVIGPPLVAANQNAILPMRWSVEGASPGLFDSPDNTDDQPANRNAYYWLYDESGAVTWNGVTLFGKGRPKFDATGIAVYGDGYAIAGYRARNGRFKSIFDVKNALTYVERTAPADGKPDDPLERLEIEVKFAALKDYITLDSWVDTTTVCVGKFEWVTDPNTSGVFDTAIDRDKSWVIDDPVKDPLNIRGSLRGCYVSIMNGQGAGQLRRIRTNGADWIQIETFPVAGSSIGFGGAVTGTPSPKATGATPPGAFGLPIGAVAIPPGPISSYMIIAPEDAKLVDVNGNDLPYSYPENLPPSGTLAFPKTNPNGTLVDEPGIDYSLRPLCIHRAPVNVNTASDKVLAALFMGINIQQGHPMAIGTDADLKKISPPPALLKDLYTVAGPPAVLSNPNADDWKVQDGVLGLQPYLLTPKGLKRIPADAGRMVFNRPMPTANPSFAYLNNYGTVDPAGTSNVNEAHELAYRIICARQRDVDPLTGYPVSTPNPDPITADPGDGPAPFNMPFAGYERGPFKSWDDLYFRVIKPWDDIRSGYFVPGKPTIPNSGSPGLTVSLGKESVARMLMAHFNPNTDLLKFNPNIEWIDRWGRNFTEMEPVMVFQGAAPASGPSWSSEQWANSKPSTVGTAPPRIPPKGSYFIRSMRYQSDEMIDKSDLNRSTTEFSFDSGGIYEIQSTGQVIKGTSVMAERKFQALVKIYDIWRETTQAQFVQGTFSQAVQPGDASGLRNLNTINTGTSSGWANRGSITRDSLNVNKYLALQTLPEPLVPLGYRINAFDPAYPLADVVDADTLGHDAFGRSKSVAGSTGLSQVPDVIANKVLPAQYDGQIVLASNTEVFQTGTDADTFLASFNGDLDTDTSLGNGHEQAKTPTDSTVRVLDTIGLLGRLNDSEIDLDPEAYDLYIVKPSVSSAMQPLQPRDTDPIIPGRIADAYWNNLSIRMGDLRGEGVYLGTLGTSLKDATLKYVFGSCDAPQAGSLGLLNSVPPKSQLQNFDPGNTNGCTVSLWFKPSWHGTDNYEHEFFNGGSTGDPGNAFGRYNYIYKSGRFSFSKPNDNPPGTSPGGNGASQFERNNDLSFGSERADDGDLLLYLHGGTNRVDPKYLPGTKGDARLVKSPAYEVQPFRWAFTGAWWHYNLKTDPAPQPNSPDSVGVNPAPPGAPDFGTYWANPYGYFQKGYGTTDPVPAPALVNAFVTTMGRPFISTQLNPEGDWNQKYFWIDTWTPSLKTGMSNCTLRGQPAAYTTWPIYANAPNALHKYGCFSINNVNEAGAPDNSPPSAPAGPLMWIYRSTPLDGTYAVVDELKLSKAQWTSDRIAAEQTLSRYFLPQDPRNPAQCPTFTSQTMLQSIKGFNKTTSSDSVTLMRVSWNCFTPRFMHEYKRPGTYTRNEVDGHFVSNVAVPRWQIALSDVKPAPFKGPFDYVQYNYDNGGCGDVGYGWKNPQVNAFKPVYGVDRLPTLANKQSPYTKGVEIELLDSSTGVPAAVNGWEWNVQTGMLQSTTVFHNPDSINTFVDISKPPSQRTPVTIKPEFLQYRVRFRYPVNPDIDPVYAVDAGALKDGTTLVVDPARHYLLDTPVFDDISVTYALPPRILQYQELAE